ncbi:MAG: RNA polymerase factor sigma-54 [Bacteroidales bacterium]|jgi:RNA polymerase sigma-54 factor|nr:RNA polymerase factor sigma-54 [Bacteroidales bacterium]
MLHQKLQLKLQQKLSPQQIQVIKLLEVPSMLLEQRIKQEIEENPALEVDNDTYESDSQEQNESDNSDEFSLDDYFNEDEYNSYKYKTNNNSSNQDNKEIPFSQADSFKEFLFSQLGLQELDEHQMVLADFLIGNIDEDGYLRRDLESIADDILFTQNVSVGVKELETVLSVIQSLDPPGVAARSLQECLLLQIKRKKKSASIITATYILRDYYDDFVKKHYDKIIQKLDIEEEHLKNAIDVIVKLNPKPGGEIADQYSKSSSYAIIPDFILEEQNGDFSIQLHSKNSPDIRVNKTYGYMLQDLKNKKAHSKQQKEAIQFVKQKLDSAKWFIDAVQQRYETLLGTMYEIFEYQKDFFISGDEAKLKPMILKDIADRTGLDISTISRVANSKYIQTPYGVFALKYFFSEGLQNESGDEVSSREIKSILQDVISQEDKKKPYTDEKLSAVLKEKGYLLARRTVAKYREQLGIPVGRLRKEL